MVESKTSVFPVFVSLLLPDLTSTLVSKNVSLLKLLNMLRLIFLGNYDCSFMQNFPTAAWAPKKGLEFCMKSWLKGEIRGIMIELGQVITLLIG